MTTATIDLAHKTCVPCTGKILPLSADRIQELAREIPEWGVSVDGNSLSRKWRVKDFGEALDFFERVGWLAEAENHHPDLHLTNFREVQIELSTHAIHALSENDFILAAKIDLLPVSLKEAP